MATNDPQYQDHQNENYQPINQFFDFTGEDHDGESSFVLPSSVSPFEHQQQYQDSNGQQLPSRSSRKLQQYQLQIQQQQQIAHQQAQANRRQQVITNPFAFVTQPNSAKSQQHQQQGQQDQRYVQVHQQHLQQNILYSNSTTSSKPTRLNFI
jgi:hypothetical protein